MRPLMLPVFLFSVCWTSAHGQVSVRVSPDSTQFEEYKKQISVSCEGPGAGDWTVWRFIHKRSSVDLSECGRGWGNWSLSVCVLTTLKPDDSGVYWCESKSRESSKTINITVTSEPVILESTVQVREGQDLVLTCRSTNGRNKQTEADFYRNESLLTSSPSATTIVRFSRDQQGVYKCGFKGSSTLSPPAYIYLQEDSAPPVLVLSPDSAQVHEYKSVELKCDPPSRAEGWTVQRYKDSKSGTEPRCGSGPVCVLNTIKFPDSGIYWCGRNTRRSNSVNLTVYSKGVVLQSPVLPVTEGQTVSLSCLHHTSSNLSARFHRDGHFLSEQPTGHMTIQQVSASDEGLYQCEIQGELSESSWIHVRPGKPQTLPSAPSISQATPSTSQTPPLTSQTPPPASGRPPVLALLCHLVVFCPYVVSTVLMVSLFRTRTRETGSAAPVAVETAPPSGLRRMTSQPSPLSMISEEPSPFV